MPYTPKTYTNQVTAEDLSRAETGIQTAQAGVDLAAPQSRVSVVEEAAPTFDQKGALGNGIANDTAAMQAALNTGIVHRGLPGRRYIISGAGLQLFPGGGLGGHNKRGMEYVTNAATTVASEIVNNDAGQPVLILPNGGSGVAAESQYAAVSLDGFRLFANGGACIYAPNGAIDVDLGNLVLNPGTGGKGIHFKGFIQDWRQWGWTRVQGGKYGVYADAQTGVNGDGCRMDSCDLNVYASGATKYGIHLRVPISDSCTWRTRIVNAGEHGMVLLGGYACFTLLNPVFEGNGFNQLGLTPATTGSMTAGSATLTVASATGFANGQTVCVAGAGAVLGGSVEGARDLVTTITAGGGTTSLTLAVAATNTVTAADVTRALYSDLYCGVDLGSPEGLGTALGGGATNVTAISPQWGINTVLRYAVEAYGTSGLVIVNPKQLVRPVYDPPYSVPHIESIAANPPMFRPTRGWQTPLMGAGWTPTAGQSFACRRIGRRVQFRGYATAGAGATGTACTLPPGCRPSRNVVIHDVWDSANVAGAGIIAPSGVVTSYTTSTGTTVFEDGASFTVD